MQYSHKLRTHEAYSEMENEKMQCGTHAQCTENVFGYLLAKLVIMDFSFSLCASIYLSACLFVSFCVCVVFSPFVADVAAGCPFCTLKIECANHKMALHYFDGCHHEKKTHTHTHQSCPVKDTRRKKCFGFCP